MNEIDNSMVLQLLQRATELLKNPCESVRILSTILIERLLTQCQLSGSLTSASRLARRGVLNPKDLTNSIIPLSEYFLTVSSSVKQTDHYLMKAFLRMVLFFNNEVRQPRRLHRRSCPTPRSCWRSCRRISRCSARTSPTRTTSTTSSRRSSPSCASPASTPRCVSRSRTV